MRRQHPVYALAFAAWCVLFASISRADPAWPRIALPPGARVQGPQIQMAVDGRPTRMQIFRATEQPRRLRAWFQASLGSDSVVSALPSGGWVVGHPQGTYYVSVQLTQGAGGETKGVMAVTQFGDAQRRRRGALRRISRLLGGLPADAEVLRDVEFRSGGHDIVEVVIKDKGSLAWNAACLASSLKAAGLREVKPTTPPFAEQDATRLLEYRSGHASAMAVLERTSGLGTTMVLQWIRDGNGP